MNTTFSAQSHFDRQYQTHLKHLKLKGLQPKTIDAYSRTIRRIGARFDHQIDNFVGWAKCFICPRVKLHNTRDPEKLARRNDTVHSLRVGT